MPLPSDDEMKKAAEAIGLNVARMEAASDKIVALCTELGVTRQEMTSICFALGSNHAIALQTPLKRVMLAVMGMYVWRERKGLDPRVLVPETSSKV